MIAAVESERATTESVRQKQMLAMHKAAAWETRARLAQAESRRLDAVASCLRASNATPRDFDPVGRTRFADQAHQVWLTAGGTEEGWLVCWPEAAAGPPQWTTIGRQMPDFSLQDTAGHPVRLSDLERKTVFINVSATWCGPCQGELPRVQRLYDTLQGPPGRGSRHVQCGREPRRERAIHERAQLFVSVVLAQRFVDEVTKVEAIPRNWIIDTAGQLRFERSAGFDDTFVKDAIAAMGQAAK